MVASTHLLASEPPVPGDPTPSLGLPPQTLHTCGVHTHIFRPNTHMYKIKLNPFLKNLFSYSFWKFEVPKQGMGRAALFWLLALPSVPWLVFL